MKDLQKTCTQAINNPFENINEITNLLRLINSEERSENEIKLIIDFVVKFFRAILGRIELSKETIHQYTNIKLDEIKEESEILQVWIFRTLKTFKKYLYGFIQKNKSLDIKIKSFAALMEFVAIENLGKFNVNSFRNIIENIIKRQDIPIEVYNLFFNKYSIYADVTYYTYIIIYDQCIYLLKKYKFEKSIKNEILILFKFLNHLPKNLSEFKDERGIVKSWCGATEIGISYPILRKKKSLIALKQHILSKTDDDEYNFVKWCTEYKFKHAFSDAWLHFLNLPLSDEILKLVLKMAPEEIIPNFSMPLILSEIFTKMLNRGGTLAIMSLESVFMLMSAHKYEYKDFYSKLYHLLEPSLFLEDERIKIFTLIDIFLKSSNIPAFTAAAFIKKFMRMALVSPPNGIIICITFVYNLLIRHPACEVMLKRNHLNEINDIYDEAQNVEYTRAIESSLYEINILKNHYCPKVRLHMKILIQFEINNNKHANELKLLEDLKYTYLNLSDDYILQGQIKTTTTVKTKDDADVQMNVMPGFL